MAVNDVYEVALNSRLFGQDCANVFHFVMTAPTPAPSVVDTLINAFLPLRVSGMRAMSLNDVVYTAIRARNLFNADEDVTRSIALPGSSGAVGPENSTLPSFNSYGFTMNTAGGSVGNGSKRLVGVPESAVVDGVVTDGGYLGQGISVANSFANDLTVGGTPGGTPVFSPVIVKRVRSGTPNNYKYRLPENLAETVIARIISGLFNVLITTQLSRKIGIGS